MWLLLEEASEACPQVHNGDHANSFIATAGLTVAAYLQDFGLKALVIERDQRVGDVWRARYKVYRWPIGYTRNKLLTLIESSTPYTKIH